MTERIDKCSVHYVKEAITELTSKLATGEKLLGYDVDETSKKINSMIFNTVQEAKWQVKNNIRARIMDYKENLVNKFKETFKEVADKEKRR